MTGRLQPAVDRITTHPWVLRYVPRAGGSRPVAPESPLGRARRRGRTLLRTDPRSAAGVRVDRRAASVVARTSPMAVVTTFYTNPFTIVPLYVVAYEYGTPRSSATRRPSSRVALPPSTGFTTGSRRCSTGWSQLGKPLAVGLRAARGHARRARLGRGARRLALPRGVGVAAARAPARARRSPGVKPAVLGHGDARRCPRRDPVLQRTDRRAIPTSTSRGAAIRSRRWRARSSASRFRSRRRSRSGTASSPRPAAAAIRSRSIRRASAARACRRCAASACRSARRSTCATSRAISSPARSIRANGPRSTTRR